MLCDEVLAILDTSVQITLALSKGVDLIGAGAFVNPSLPHHAGCDEIH